MLLKLSLSRQFCLAITCNRHFGLAVMAKETKKQQEAREKAEAKQTTLKTEGASKAAPETPTRAELSGMIGHLKYHQGKSEDVKLALELYQQAPSKDAKRELFALFKSDKTCKWAKTYSVVSESKSSSSTGTLSGVCTWYFQQIS